MQQEESSEPQQSLGKEAKLKNVILKGQKAILIPSLIQLGSDSRQGGNAVR